MAHYTIKTEDKLRWNCIRRVITREYDTRAQNKRERDLNQLISAAETKFVKSLQTGEPMVIESHYTQLVDAILRDNGVRDIEIEDPDGYPDPEPRSPMPAAKGFIERVRGTRAA